MKKGFTLIEVLVVIVIIVILSLILIFYFEFAGDKARDASIKEFMGAPLTKLSIEYYASHPEGFGDFCNELGPAGIGFLEKIDSSNEEHPYCSSNEKKWAACAELYSDSEKAWCVDSTGTNKEIDINQCTQSIKFCP